MSNVGVATLGDTDADIWNWRWSQCINPFAPHHPPLAMWSPELPETGPTYSK